MKYPPTYKVKSSLVFPIFKKKCISCGQEFHFEIGRKYPSYFRVCEWYYLCKSCSTIGPKKADAFFQSHINNIKALAKPTWPKPPGRSFSKIREKEETNDYIKIIKEEK